MQVYTSHLLAMPNACGMRIQVTSESLTVAKNVTCQRGSIFSVKRMVSEERFNYTNFFFI